MSKCEDDAMDLIEMVAENSHHNAAKPFGRGAMPKALDAKSVTCGFRASLKHKDDGQTKFIKPNSQRQDIRIKHWVSIG